MSVPLTNLLLESLPHSEQAVLKASLEPVPLPFGTIIFEPERVPRYMYFLTSGVTSVVTTMTRGDSIEVGLVGREGLPGSTNVFGGAAGPAHCFVQVEGTGLRIDFHTLQQMFMKCPGLHRRVLQFVQYENAVLNQISACNRVHDVEKRLARWLLMLEDRTELSDIPLTQEFIGEMLGSRRSTVTVALGNLERGGVIRHRRSKVSIVDRGGLKHAACECYEIVRRQIQNLYRDVGPTQLVIPGHGDEGRSIP